MMDDRKATPPYVVVFSPGDPIGRVDQMTPSEASSAVGGYASQSVWGRKYLVYQGGHRAMSGAAAPNRLFDGHIIYGLMVVMGLDKPLTGRQAVELSQDCPWRMI